MTEADTRIVVVLGKTKPRVTEIPALRAFGQALHYRGKRLFTTNSEGAPKIIREAYEEAGGQTTFLTKGFIDEFESLKKHKPVLIFSDAKFLRDLDAKVPNWRDRGWIVIHNPKETMEAARLTAQVLSELGPA